MPITITHVKSNTIADFTGTVTVYNSAGATTTAVASDLVRPSDWNSNHVATIALTGSEVASLFNIGTGLSSTSGAGGVSIGLANMPFWEPFPLANTNSTLSAPGIGTWYLDGPYALDAGLPKGQMHLLAAAGAGFIGGANYSAATIGSVSNYQTLYHNLAFYQLDPGNTNRLSSVWSMQNIYAATMVQNIATANTSSGTVTIAMTLSFPSQWDTAGGVTYISTSTSQSTNLTTSTMVSSGMDSFISTIGQFLTGSIQHIFGLSSALAPGVYWLAHQYTSTSSSTGTSGGIGTARMFSTQSRLGLLENLVNAYKRLGSSASNSTTNMPYFHGYLATTTSLASAVIAMTDMRGTTGRAYWNFAQSTY